MKDFRTSGICQAKKGMLFLRDCGSAAIAQCHKCGRPVCTAHQLMDGSQTICPDCFTQDDTIDHQPKPDVTNRTAATTTRRYRTRSSYYSRYGYTPFYFGHSHYYSDRDYRTFDQAENESGETAAWEEAVAGDELAEAPDYGEMDEFMES